METIIKEEPLTSIRPSAGRRPSFRRRNPPLVSPISIVFGGGKTTPLRLTIAHSWRA